MAKNTIPTFFTRFSLWSLSFIFTAFSPYFEKKFHFNPYYYSFIEMSYVTNGLTYMTNGLTVNANVFIKIILKKLFTFLKMLP